MTNKYFSKRNFYDRCWSSHIGRAGYKQTISLGQGCMQKGTILHELMHGIGFHHEHSRSDRNNYVKILDENLPNGEFHSSNDLKLVFNRIERVAESELLLAMPATEILEKRGFVVGGRFCKLCLPKCLHILTISI